MDNRLKNKSGIFRILKWTGKGGLAVLDQGLFAGANFVVNILLARWLPPSEYGAFAVAFSVFLLLAAFHSAFIIEPMLVFGAGKYFESFREYLKFLLYGHRRFTGMISLALGFGAFIFFNIGKGNLAHAFLGLALVSPFILKIWLLRRAFYIHLGPCFSAIGGMLYVFMMALGIYGLHRQNYLSTFSALIIMGISSIFVGMWLSNILFSKLPISNTKLELNKIVLEHWKYSKWVASTECIGWVRNNFYYILLPVWISLEGVAALRAVMNFIQPMLSFNSAISTFILPKFVRTFTQYGHAKLIKMVYAAILFFVLSAAVYWVFIYFMRHQLFALLYREKYIEYAYFLGVAGAIPVISGFGLVLKNFLRTAHRTDYIFWSYVAAGLFTLSGGVLLSAYWGILGAILSLLFTYCLVAGSFFFFYVRFQKNHKMAF